jgi:hypothetical protein
MDGELVLCELGAVMLPVIWKLPSPFWNTRRKLFVGANAAFARFRNEFLNAQH